MPDLAYHLNELAIARDPSRPQHSLPDVSSAMLGIVDVGCGIGQLFIAKDGQIQPNVNRFGFDVDQEALAYAQTHWPNVANFCVAAAEHLPLASASVDLYVSRVSLPYTDIPEALSEAARVLVPGGLFWATLHPWSMVARSMAGALLNLNPRAFAAQAIQFVNGVGFHTMGWPTRPMLVHESWQSSYRMRKVLAGAGFERITIDRLPGLFLVKARRSG